MFHCAEIIPKNFIFLFREGTTLRDEMLPFLPHLRLLSLKTKDFAEGPAQQDWLTSEEKNFIFSYQASSSSVSMSQLPCSPSIEARKKPNCHLYSGVFCIALNGKATVCVPNNDHKLNLSGFQFCVQEKIMPNIYVHDIKVYTMINGEAFKKVVRSSTFKDGQNYLVTLHLSEPIVLESKLDYKFIIKVWRQEGKESVYLVPDFENVDLGAGKVGFFLLIKCGNLFDNTISKIESIIINIEAKKERSRKPIKELMDSSDEEGLEEGDEKPEDEQVSKYEEEDEDSMSPAESVDDDAFANGNSAEISNDGALEPDADLDHVMGEVVANEEDVSYTSILLSQVDELREIMDPKVCWFFYLKIKICALSYV
jgi:hypothetical protein